MDISNFRMYPVVIGNGRLLTRDTVISGYHIPKGVRLCCNIDLN
jgi:cytochrome P450